MSSVRKWSDDDLRTWRANAAKRWDKEGRLVPLSKDEAKYVNALDVRLSNVAGAEYGLFTDVNIPKQARLGAYTGMCFDSEDAALHSRATRPDDAERLQYLFNARANRKCKYIDADYVQYPSAASIFAFANHSARPNIAFNEFGNVAALKPISAGEELLVSYGPLFNIRKAPSDSALRALDLSEWCATELSPVHVDQVRIDHCLSDVGEYHKSTQVLVKPETNTFALPLYRSVRGLATQDVLRTTRLVFDLSTMAHVRSTKDIDSEPQRETRLDVAQVRRTLKRSRPLPETGDGRAKPEYLQAYIQKLKTTDLRTEAVKTLCGKFKRLCDGSRTLEALGALDGNIESVSNARNGCFMHSVLVAFTVPAFNVINDALEAKANDICSRAHSMSPTHKDAIVANTLALVANLRNPAVKTSETDDEAVRFASANTMTLQKTKLNIGMYRARFDTIDERLGSKWTVWKGVQQMDGVEFAYFFLEDVLNVGCAFHVRERTHSTPTFSSTGADIFDSTAFMKYAKSRSDYQYALRVSLQGADAYAMLLQSMKTTRSFNALEDNICSYVLPLVVFRTGMCVNDTMTSVIIDMDVGDAMAFYLSHASLEKGKLRPVDIAFPVPAMYQDATETVVTSGEMVLLRSAIAEDDDVFQKYEEQIDLHLAALRLQPEDTNKHIRVLGRMAICTCAIVSDKHEDVKRKVYTALADMCASTVDIEPHQKQFVSDIMNACSAYDEILTSVFVEKNLVEREYVLRTTEYRMQMARAFIGCNPRVWGTTSVTDQVQHEPIQPISRRIMKLSHRTVTRIDGDLVSFSVSNPEHLEFQMVDRPGTWTAETRMTLTLRYSGHEEVIELVAVVLGDIVLKSKVTYETCGHYTALVRVPSRVEDSGSEDAFVCRHAPWYYVDSTASNVREVECENARQKIISNGRILVYRKVNASRTIFNDLRKAYQPSPGLTRFIAHTVLNTT